MGKVVRAGIEAIEYYLPDVVLNNDTLAVEFPDWPAERILAKTGIRERHIAAVDEFASDLALKAAQKLFVTGASSPERIDYLLFCTQAPDYCLPTTACMLQQRLKLPTSCGALDFNLGCSGFVYGLSLAKGLVETGQARTVLLLTADTYSKYMDPKDKSVRTLFGDAGAATLIGAVPADATASQQILSSFVFGTDGRGAQNLIVRAGSLREAAQVRGEAPLTKSSSQSTALYMDGPEIFNFTLREIPLAIQKLLAIARCELEQIDRFVFHQANLFILKHLQKKLRIPEEKFVIAMEHCGNTVSSSIPIALKDAAQRGQLARDQLLMLVGFGVGYSWAACLAKWQMA